jgi:hypothetical protein
MEMDLTKLSDLLGELPGEFQPWAVKWSVVLGGWTLEGFREWSAALQAGDIETAEGLLAERMDIVQKLGELNAINDDLAAANVAKANSRKLAVQMLWEFVSVAVGLILAPVGL